MPDLRANRLIVKYCQNLDRGFPNRNVTSGAATYICRQLQVCTMFINVVYNIDERRLCAVIFESKHLTYLSLSTEKRFPGSVDDGRTKVIHSVCVSINQVVAICKTEV